MWLNIAMVTFLVFFSLIWLIQFRNSQIAENDNIPQLNKGFTISVCLIYVIIV